MAFRSSGFPDAAEFREAREGGFDGYNDWQEAKAAGFALKSEFEQFKTSGLADKSAWLAEKRNRAELSDLRQTCVAAADSSDPLKAAHQCFRALLLAPSDVQLAKHVVELRISLADRTAELEVQVAGKVAGSKAKLDAARLTEAEARCVSERTASSLSEAARLCADLANQFAGSEFLKAAAARLAAEASALEKEAAAEQERIALENARSAAEGLMSAIEDYAQSGSRLESGIDTARALVNLRAIVGGKEAKPIEAATLRLLELLASDTGFTEFRVLRERAAKEAAANAEATALAEARRIEAFIADFVAKNVVHDAVPDLLEIQVRLADEISSGAPSRYMVGQKKATLTIEGLGLTRELAAFVVAPVERDANAPETAINGLAINALNEELLSGPLEDILLLHNSTPQAPHAIRNLLGELVFEGGRAVTCWAHSVPAPGLSVSTAKQRLLSAGISPLPSDQICDTDLLARTDVLLLRRGDFLRSNVLYAQPFVEAYEKGDFRLLAKVDWSGIKDAQAANAELSAAIEREIAAGARHGYGWIRLPVDTQTLCSMAPDSTETHRSIFDSRTPLEPDLPLEPGWMIASIEKTFILVQRRQCLLVYGSSSDLATLIAAVKRDGISYSVIPHWVTPDAFAQAEGALAAARTDEQRALAKTRLRAEANAASRKQELEARQKLIVAQAAAAANSRSAREAELQRRFSQEANGAYNALYLAAQRHFGEDARDSAFAALFPDVAFWRKQKLSDGWEFEPVSGHIVDYGVAAWKDRRLEAVFAQIKLQSKNRMLGEISDDCFVVGYLIDAEFEIFRDPTASPCAEANTSLITWKQARSFESRWLAE